MEATESPLDVLSRAATMVQDSSPPDYDDERNYATKELPTARWRRERRCRDRLGDYTKLQQNKTTNVSSTYDTPTTLPLPDVLGTSTHSSTTGDTPLDMTMTRGGRPPPSYSQTLANHRNAPARPSVITCAPPASSWGDRSSDVKGSNKDENGRQGHRRELLSGMCDPVIDEHFRRSLGKDYMSLFSSDSSTTNNSNNNSNNSNGNSSITVTGLSVDDHFAKALGETWIKLQGQTSSSASSNTLITKEKKSSAAPSTATVSVSVAKETAPSSAATPAASHLQQRRGLVSI